MLSKTTVHHFAGTNVALGTAAGKLFRVGCVPFRCNSLGFRMLTDTSVMTITDPGDSDLLSVAESAAA